MKTQSTIKKVLATAAMTVAGIVPSVAQTNLGASCGCPTMSQRATNGTVLLSSLADGNQELTANTTILTCDKLWVLDKKIYVPSGKTLLIQPGTAVLGNDTITVAANAAALIVEVGGKIYADGTKDCPVVFTAQHDPMDGTYAIANKGKWGGVLIAGRATNNLTKAANGPYTAGAGNGRLCVANGVGMFEGFAAPATDHRAQFGDSVAFDDNDNSGILRYISIRYSGAILNVGGEINGLTLGSVGRGTTIDNIEILSCADDGIEFFGGTVNIKNYASLFGNDDMFDWDDGYSGKAQFIFGLKTDNTASVDSDNGFEMDADDQKSNLTPRSHPVIFNVTMIGNGKSATTSDNSGLAAIEAKELTEGEISNSIFANWAYGFNVVKTTGSRSGVSEAYHNWASTGGNGSNSLKFKCNTFVGCTYPFAIDKLGAVGKVDASKAITGTVASTDTAQFLTTDKNKIVASIAGFDYAFTVNNNGGTSNPFSDKTDIIPTPALSNASGCPTPPQDGFFTPATYKGAFASAGDTWISDWSQASMLGVSSGIVHCISDTNADGTINVTDFLKVLGDFGTNCN